MKTLYFDCFAGISGDMALGALADLVAEREAIDSALHTLPVGGFELRWERTERSGITATRAVVSTTEEQHHRGLPQVLEIIAGGRISERAKELAGRIFTRLAEAEAEVHGVPVDEVHFHEVGAVDAIIDIAGTAVAADLIGAERFIGSSVRTGFGTVNCAHGNYPIPAPGTAALLKGVPAYAGDYEGEWTTPTGAAILTGLCDRFQPLPTMRVEGIGYGAGGRTQPELPNLLRVFFGELLEETPQEVMVLEAELDDLNPQLMGHLHSLLPKHGALDWYTTSVQMKKNRPGVMLTVVFPPERRTELADLIFRETTTIGYRYYRAAREELEREIVIVETPIGDIGVKVARRGGRVVNAMPEFEDCRKIAEATGRPLKEVRNLAIRTYYEKRG